MVEDLVFHADARNYSCRTTIEIPDERPLDDVLSHYQEIRYDVVA